MKHRASPARWGPWWSRRVGWSLARILWATDVRRKDAVPKKGPVIVVANHVGLIDGPILHGVIPRPSHFLVGSHMFRGVLGVLLRAAGQIKVDGGGRGALQAALAMLRRGVVVGMFPEGTRGTGRAVAVHGGAAWLALHSGAPIVPAAIVGTRHTGEPVGVWPRPRRRIVIEFGAPLFVRPPVTLKGRARQEWAAQAVSDALRGQVESTLAHTDLTLPADEGRVNH